ncbi:TatD family hydrolase [Vibrio methylphosphonaticus]|uniref:TatD family hydrolase n=1 Tax=Vibrio methylphosphonaticus TaxID=2946866 RepID=UPI002029F9B3|nr:TatD family hydrolase [Vibrio methylphosphonaticus]MCL9773319.1 TatD family hydrolase [Vibrio methylphosphonaticus]
MIDTHCHLDLIAAKTDLSTVLKDARRAGVEGMIVPGINEENWTEIAQLAQQHSDIYYALGFHPLFLTGVSTVSVERLTQRLTQAQSLSNKCVAIGECGLDFYHLGQDGDAEPTKLQQRQILREHILLANKAKLPIILHCRKAHQDMIAVLKKHTPIYGGVIHGFSGSYQQAMDYIKLGIYIGVGGVISYERAKKTRDTISKLPLDYLLIETDAPDMPLSGYQGTINKPEMLKLTLSTLIMLRSESAQTVTSQLLNNSKSLFFICDKSYV